MIMRNFTSALLTLPVIFSCTESIDDAPDRDIIGFSISGCRGITAYPEDMTFSLSAHLDDGGPAITDYAWNVKMSQTNGIWKSDTPLFWMNGMDISFYAVIPYQNDTADERLRLHSAGESPAVIYSAPESSDGQIGILTATDRRSSGTVALDFRHINACIRFVCGREIQDGVSISEISLDGVYKKATYRIESEQWQDIDCIGKCSISDIRFTMGSGIAVGDPISVRHFFLPPQETQAQISVSITDGGSNDIYTVPVGHTVWEAGKIYTYTISYSGRKLTVSSTESLMETGNHYIDDRDEIL
mgnify:CR=1 FL=1